MPSARREEGPGFTLLELIVVIVLITIATAMAAPNLIDQVRAAAVRKAAMDFIALSQLARSSACLHQEPMELRVDGRKGRMEICGGEEPVSRGSGIEAIDRLFENKGRKRREAKDRAWRDLPGAVRCVLTDTGRDEFRVAFRPDGSSEERRVRFYDPAGRDVVVRVDPVTGRARVEGRP